MPYATATDVRDQWIGDDLAATDPQITAKIGQAERMILRRVPGLVANIAANRLTTDDVKDVVVAMVSRVLRNPKGSRQVATTTGPFTVSETAAGNEPGGLYISDDELSDLNPSNSGRRRAFSVTTAPGML